MFGNTLQDVMDLQKDRYPIRQLPWIQVTLSEALLNSQGTRILEGIFRSVHQLVQRFPNCGPRTPGVREALTEGPRKNGEIIVFL